MSAMRNPWGMSAVLALAIVANSSSAFADPPFDTAIDVQTFNYAIGPKTFFTVSDGDVATPKQLAVDALITYLTKPFTVYNYDPAAPIDFQIWMNGREWLSRELDGNGVGYCRTGTKFGDLTGRTTCCGHTSAATATIPN